MPSVLPASCADATGCADDQPLLVTALAEVRVEAATLLLNPADVLAWNTYKP